MSQAPYRADPPANVPGLRTVAVRSFSDPYTVPSSTPTLYDLFADTDGTLLTAHTPSPTSNGNPWVAQQGTMKVSPSGTVISNTYVDGDTATIDAGPGAFTLSATLYGTLTGTNQPAQSDLLVRWASLTSYVCVELNPYPQLVTLQTRSGGTVVPLITYSVPGGIVSGQAVDVRVDVYGPEITLWVNGTEIASAYSTFNVNSTLVGFRTGKSGGNVAGSAGMRAFKVQPYQGSRLNWPRPVKSASNPVVPLGASRTVTDAVTNGTTTITSATAAFVAGDVGRPVTGTNIPTGGTPLGTRIASVTNSTTAVMTVAASGSSAGGTLTLASWDGTDANNPNVTWDPVNARWVLYYSGYFADSGGGTSFQHMGLAYADSPLGPWTKDPLNPVFTTSLAEGGGSMNGGLVYHGGQWLHLYRSGILATSPDLHAWTRVGTVLPVGSAGAWDENLTFDHFLRVMQDGSTLECWYGGRNNASVRGIGRAMSVDGGYTWTKDPRNPILSAAMTPFAQNAQFGEPSVLVPEGKEGQEMLITFDCSPLAPTGSGFALNRQIGGAITVNGGSTWHFRTNILQGFGVGASWESKQNIDSFLMVDGTRLYAFYGGADTTGSALNLHIQVGVATQQWSPLTFIGTLVDEG